MFLLSQQNRIIQFGIAEKYTRCKRQFGLDPHIFIINLLACATSVVFVSSDFGSGFWSIISRLCSHRKGKI